MRDYYINPLLHGFQAWLIQKQATILLLINLFFPSHKIFLAILTYGLYVSRAPFASSNTACFLLFDPISSLLTYPTDQLMRTAFQSSFSDGRFHRENTWLLTCRSIFLHPFASAPYLCAILSTNHCRLPCSTPTFAYGVKSMACFCNCMLEFSTSCKVLCCVNILYFSWISIKRIDSI